MTRPEQHLCRRCRHPRSAHPRRGCTGQVMHAEPFAGYPAVLGPCDCRRYRRPRLLDLLRYR